MVRKFIKKMFQGENNTPTPVDREIDHMRTHVHQLQAHVFQQQQNFLSWHHYLHNSIQHVQNDHKKLESNHKQHVDGVSSHKSEIEMLKKTIALLEKHQKSEQTTVQQLSDDIKALKQALMQTFGEYNKHIMDLHKQIAVAKETSPQDVSAPVKVSDPQPSRQEPELKSEPKRESQRQSVGELTPSEKILLAVLLETDKKYSYRDLAASCNKSPSTIKTQINSLKNKGIPLAEFSDADGCKRFYVVDAFKRAQ